MHLIFRLLTFVLLFVLVFSHAQSAFCYRATFSYDGLDRLNSVVMDDGMQIVYTYDSAGNLLSVSRPDDQDNDGMNDDWEREHFGGTGRNGSGDADGDGLSDREEYAWKTDPTDKDSDNDGIPDGWEAAHFPYCDPLRNDAGLDPDGDGYTNYQEYLGGSDPGDPNSFPSNLGTKSTPAVLLLLNGSR